ncbi:MAG: fatty acid--CoA ligase family protein, partial [Parvularculaceae bacterium]|nr:fatty acid--CoA ligase family protein [Parvularculaceae bacterium]
LARVAPALLVGDVARARRLGDDSRNRLYTASEFLASADDAAKTAPTEAADGEGVAVQLFTSGTTGAPKAAILRHSNLLSYILGSVEFGAAGEDEAALVSVPPYHIAGISALMSSVYALRRMALLPAFDPDAWLAVASAERVTNAFLVPTMLTRIIDRLEKGPPRDLSSLRAVAYGGGRMPPEVIRKALDFFPTVGFANAYGLTETSSTIALLGPEDHRRTATSDDPAVRARLESVGRALPSVEIEIRDESGRALGPGERGEIYVRGPQVSGEYREKSALDAEGWFPTRDAGWLDAEGYLFLSGRSDDVIVRGGENISPGEIEDVLRSHPAIADAAVVAMPSMEWGEAVGAALVLRDGATRPDDSDLRDLVRARLRSSRVPERILYVDALPYNEMGKLLRRVVKARFAAP